MKIINTAATKLEKHIVHEEEHQKHHEGGEQRDEHAVDEFDERTDDGDEITTRFNQRIDDQAGDGDIQEVIDVLVRNEPKSPVEQVLMIETSQSTIKEYDPIVLTLMFPDLYLFGRCGLDEKRVISTSVEFEIFNCLKLFNRRFAQHPLFQAVAFNILRRERKQ